MPTKAVEKRVRRTSKEVIKDGIKAVGKALSSEGSAPAFCD